MGMMDRSFSSNEIQSRVNWTFCGYSSFTHDHDYAILSFFVKMYFVKRKYKQFFWQFYFNDIIKGMKL